MTDVPRIAYVYSVPLIHRLGNTVRPLSPTHPPTHPPTSPPHQNHQQVYLPTHPPTHPLQVHEPDVLDTGQELQSLRKTLEESGRRLTFRAEVVSTVVQGSGWVGRQIYRGSLTL